MDKETRDGAIEAVRSAWFDIRSRLTDCAGKYEDLDIDEEKIEWLVECAGMYVRKTWQLKKAVAFLQSMKVEDT